MHFKFNRKMWKYAIGIVIVLFLIIIAGMFLGKKRINKFGDVGIPSFVKTGRGAIVADAYAKTALVTTNNFAFKDAPKYYEVYQAEVISLNVENFAKRYHLQEQNFEKIAVYTNKEKTISLSYNKTSGFYNITLLTKIDPNKIFEILKGDAQIVNLKIYSPKLNSWLFDVDESKNITTITGLNKSFKSIDSGVYKALLPKEAFTLALNSGDKYWGAFIDVNQDDVPCLDFECSQYDLINLINVPKDLKVNNISLAYAPIYTKTGGAYLVPVYIIQAVGTQSYEFKKGQKSNVEVRARFIVPAYDYTLQ